MTELVIERLNQVSARIARAAERSGRNPSEVKLVAVSKGVSPERLKKVLPHGLRVFGENRVQEFLQKYEILGRQAEWHLIGHLQRNKAKYLIGKIAFIHSLDNFELAKLLDKLSSVQGRPWRVLIQVNVAGEATKFGVAPSQLAEFLDLMQGLKGLEVCGLMTIAPYCEDPEEVRPVFRKLRELREEVSKTRPRLNLMDLSMGMSNDFEVAVEEGATIVRIGSALFAG
ncbi:MAG: YggS family pyridoxal phosphate-dependent enzyme [Bacillota bacterium]|nr:YggS family pyridoxal phosphate-dependent enzyme [Bacillota bacterium]